MNTKYLEYIIALSEEGSITNAAKRLGISQPALGNYLNNLEEALGISIFVRNKKKSTLTPAGKIYIEAAKKMCQIKNQTYQTIAMMNGSCTERFTVGVTPFRGSLVIAKIFADFYAKYPHTDIIIKEGYMQPLREALLNGSIDFVMGTTTDTDNLYFDYVTICKEEIVLQVPSYHPAASFANAENSSELNCIDISLFKDTPFILCGTHTTIRRITDGIFEKAGFAPTVIFESNNTLLVDNMIRQGTGAGFVPKSYIVQNADVVYFSVSPKYYLYIGISYRKNHVLTEAQKYFLSLIIKSEVYNDKYQKALNSNAEQILNEHWGRVENGYQIT